MLGVLRLRLGVVRGWSLSRARCGRPGDLRVRAVWCRVTVAIWTARTNTNPAPSPGQHPLTTKKRRTQWNSHLSAPSAPLKRKKPVKKRNAARIKKRREACFGDAVSGKASWIRTLPCVLFAYVPLRASECGGVVEAAHTISRGAGGDARVLVPMCTKHHHEQHATGILTFESKYALSLIMAADLYEALWSISPHNPENQQ